MRMYSNLLLGNGLVQRQQSPSMLNVACCGGAECCCSEEVKESVKEVVVFVSPTVGGSFVGAIGGGGVSLAVLGFMVVVVCSVSNERAATWCRRRTRRGPVSINTAVPLKVLLSADVW